VTDYKPIAVEAAKRIAQQFDKQVVVIFATDRPHERVHVTSYGVSAEDKCEAAQIADLIGQRFGDYARREEFEDFRHVPAAQAKAREEQLMATIRNLIGAVLSCRRENTPEWMEFLVENINAACEACGSADRFVYHRNGIVRAKGGA
jgi:hypothetical protein